MPMKKSIIINIISSVLPKMLEYQEKHNTKSMCMTNTQYLYDYIIGNLKHHGIKNVKDVKIIPVIAVGKKNEITVIVDCHFVIDYNNKIYDPSYEICSLKFKSYFRTIKEYNNSKYPKLTKKQIGNFINAIKRSEYMNEGDFAYISKGDDGQGRNYYHKQADFVEGISK